MESIKLLQIYRQSVNVNGIVQLFKNISEEDISRPSGTIDVLIGYVYAAYHPQNEQTSGRLLLLKKIALEDALVEHIPLSRRQQEAICSIT